MRWRWCVSRLPVRLACAGVLLTVSAGYAWAQRTPGCAADPSPTWAASFTDLRAQVGEVMGAPVTCAMVDAEGDTVQVTTTGIAISHPSGMAVFASGDDHWALTAQGLETWTANWHNGFDPPVNPTPAPLDSADDADPIASVQAFTVMGASAQDPSATLVEGDAGRQYVLRTTADCDVGPEAQGGRVYVRWVGPRAGAGATLIDIERHAACPITALDPAGE
jgi:hypothetical protein